MMMMKKMVMLRYEIKTLNLESTLHRFLKISGQLLIKADNVSLHPGKHFRYVPLCASCVSFSAKMLSMDLQI